MPGCSLTAIYYINANGPMYKSVHVNIQYEHPLLVSANWLSQIAMQGMLIVLIVSIGPTHYIWVPVVGWANLLLN